jgi:hypothetical protein
MYATGIFGLLCGIGIIGRFLVMQLSGAHRAVFVEWCGAWVATTLVSALLSCGGGLFFTLDPRLFFLQAPLIGGCVASTVELSALAVRSTKRGSQRREILKQALPIALIGALCLSALERLQRSGMQM